MHFDGSAHEFDGVLGHRQAQATAAVPVGETVVLLAERFEYLRDKIAVHAHACVGDGELNRAFLVAAGHVFNDEAHRAGHIGVLHGVVENAHEHVFELRFIAE